MLIPRRIKHRKQHHPGRHGAATGGTTIAFGDYGIQALEPAYVTNRQIESARIAMTRYMKRGGKVWINIYPDRPLTKKPAETRMGSGAGSMTTVWSTSSASPRKSSSTCASSRPPASWRTTVVFVRFARTSLGSTPKWASERSTSVGRRRLSDQY